MRAVRAWFAKLWGVFQRNRAEQSLAAEIESHLAMHIADNLRRGMTPAEASREALLKLGGRDVTKEAWRDQRRLPVWSTAAQDARFAFRTMRRSPALTAVAVLTLALGIGANTAVFSIVDGVLLRPLPYRDPARLMYVYSSSVARGWPIGPTSPPDYREMRDHTLTLASLSAYFNSGVNMNGDFQAERLSGMTVSTEFFDTLGVKPLFGRTFVPRDGVWGSNHVVILSETLWRTRFGGRSGILGTVLRLDGDPYTVIGVMPGSFEFQGAQQIWMPMSFRPGDNLDSHDNYFMQMAGRLKAGVSREQARTDLDAIMAGVALRQPENKGIGAGLMPLTEYVVGDVRRSLWVLLAAVGFVLLICCVNLSSLLLSRDAARKKEFALRAALGAGRARLLRQFLTENIILALIGGCAAMSLAYAAIAKARTLAVDVPRIQSVSVDLPVLLFALAVSVGAGLVSGLGPYLWSSRSDLMGALREGRFQASGTRGSGRLRSGLIPAEVALAFVLAIGAGLMIRSFDRILHVNPGFDPHNVLTFTVSPPESYSADAKPTDLLPPARLTAFYDRLEERLRHVPGVATAGVSSAVPLDHRNWTKFLSFDDRPAPASMDAVAHVLFHATGGDFFRAMGMTLRKGRFFDAGDNATSPFVAVINEAAAKRFYPNEDPIGKLVVLFPPEQLVPVGQLPKGFRFPRVRIVGIVKDVHYASLQSAPDPELYAPFSQSDFVFTMSVAVRGRTAPASLIPAVRAAVAEIDRNVPIDRVSTMEDLTGASVALPRWHTLLLGIFGALALGLAAVGLYGVMAQSVAQRRHEVGVRIALGARPQAIVGGIVARAMAMVGVGLLMGCVLALALTRLMASLLFGIAPTDPTTFVGAALVLITTSALASYLPARRAAWVDPIEALRCE
ncbi:MAG TPA: ABC transporter permease [Bryobacteraceae bacterium]|nr:ABC transporter permease [Bryobacteraceae bacterium]